MIYDFTKLDLRFRIWSCDHDHNFLTKFEIMLTKVREVKKFVNFHENDHESCCFFMIMIIKPQNLGIHKYDHEYTHRSN